ncbi:MAG: GNAT family N-acetyltransferase [Rhodobacteraceae bacterium]|nr:GNAT family N-acetyltransferase [Paracoccaceae bacterium]
MPVDPRLRAQPRRRAKRICRPGPARSSNDCAAVFLLHGRRALYKFGASDFCHQHLRANNLVMWDTIVRLAGSGFRTLDFGRTSLDNAGLRRFKLGWGSTESRLHYYRLRCADGSMTPISDRSSGWHTAVIQRMPIRMARWLGSLLYRYQT